MNTLNHLVFDIKNIAYGGSQSDDTPVSDRQVAYWINQVRAVLVEQLMNTNRSIPDAFVQHLECIELECVDSVECCDTTLNSGEKVLRSTQKLPITIQRKGRNTIVSVSSIDQKISFSQTSHFRQKVNKYNKFTKSSPRWYIKNDYLYVINGSVLDRVSVAGVFDDPTEALEFTKCDGTSCFTWDSSYPVTNKMSKTITDIILKDRFGIVLSSPRDDANDGRGRTEPSTNLNSNEQG
tara:strand:- start:146 stop:856 length:711 start_codon:yes stop_codon:yes gene_type:complete